MARRAWIRVLPIVTWGGVAVAALLLCAWFWSGEHVTQWTRRGGWCFLARGEVLLGWIDLSGLPAEKLGIGVRELPMLPNGTRFWWRLPDWATRGNIVLVSIPLWCILPIPLLGSVIAWRLQATARRDAATPHCPRCNFDRTGLPLLAACPECGAGDVGRPLKPLRKAVEAAGLNALLLVVIVGGLILLCALVRSLL